MSLRNCVRDQGGAAMVEAALILPVLLVLVFGLVEMSLFFWQTGSAGKAVQLGLRKATMSDPVAIGPGLVRGASATYWNGLPPGLSCAPGPEGRTPCPTFDVRCRPGQGCVCRGTACDFSYSDRNFMAIFESMRTVMANLAPETVEIRYATNDLGYVGRPAPVPVDVTVSLIDLRYEALFLPDLFGKSLRLGGSATMPGEDLTTD